MDSAVNYWATLAERDLHSARTLLAAGDTANALFLCQQALEKALKGVLQSQSPEPPPRIHNLARLAEMGGLLATIPEALLGALLEVDPYVIEARYPAAAEPSPPGSEEAARLVSRTEEALQWLLARLKSQPE